MDRLCVERTEGQLYNCSMQHIGRRLQLDVEKTTTARVMLYSFIPHTGLVWSVPSPGSRLAIFWKAEILASPSLTSKFPWTFKRGRTGVEAQ